MGRKRQCSLGAWTGDQTLWTRARTGRCIKRWDAPPPARPVFLFSPPHRRPVLLLFNLSIPFHSSHPIYHIRQSSYFLISFNRMLSFFLCFRAAIFGMHYLCFITIFSSVNNSSCILLKRPYPIIWPNNSLNIALFIICNAIICSVASWNLSFVQENARVGMWLGSCFFHTFSIKYILIANVDGFLIFIGASGLIVIFPV